MPARGPRSVHGIANQIDDGLLNLIRIQPRSDARWQFQSDRQALLQSSSARKQLSYIHELSTRWRYAGQGGIAEQEARQCIGALTNQSQAVFKIYFPVRRLWVAATEVTERC